mmetsp:Transcript_94712/g.263441  ORF Transcript_94712/g.263441 Transcript_94712/m.263441 type:complete len:228 (-) Transcript_94712:92-775(-)
MNHRSGPVAACGPVAETLAAGWLRCPPIGSGKCLPEAIYEKFRKNKNSKTPPVKMGIQPVVSTGPSTTFAWAAYSGRPPTSSLRRCAAPRAASAPATAWAALARWPPSRRAVRRRSAWPVPPVGAGAAARRHRRRLGCRMALKELAPREEVAAPQFMLSRTRLSRSISNVRLELQQTLRRPPTVWTAACQRRQWCHCSRRCLHRRRLGELPVSGGQLTSHRRVEVVG